MVVNTATSIWDSAIGDAAIHSGDGVQMFGCDPREGGVCSSMLPNSLPLQTARQVLRTVQAAEDLIASTLPTLATHLKTTVMPPTKWDGVWVHRDSASNWTCGHLHEFVSAEHDHSNVLRRVSPSEWSIRLGNDECQVPHCEGMEILCVLLAAPRRFMYAEQLFSEIGQLQPAVAERFQLEQQQRTDLPELLQAAEEFGPELMSLLSTDDNEGVEYYDLPDTAEALADELELLASHLAAAAKDAYVGDRMRSRGRPFPKGVIPGDFAELKAKKERCESLITKLRQFEADNEKVTESAKFGNPVLEERASKALRAAISAIQARHKRIGGHLKSSLQFFNNGFYLDVDEHWRVSNDNAPR